MVLEKGYIALDNIDLIGTESDIADAKKVPEFEGFGLGSWKVWDSFQNFKQTSSEEASTADFFTIQPTFTIKDLTKAEPFMKKCVDLTQREGLHVLRLDDPGRQALLPRGLRRRRRRPGPPR